MREYKVHGGEAGHSQTPLLKQVYLQPIAQDRVHVAFLISPEETIELLWAALALDRFLPTQPHHGKVELHWLSSSARYLSCSPWSFRGDREWLSSSIVWHVLVHPIGVHGFVGIKFAWSPTCSSSAKGKPDFLSCLHGLGFPRVALSKDWGKEGIQYLSLLCILCHQGTHLIPKGVDPNFPWPFFCYWCTWRSPSWCPWHPLPINTKWTLTLLIAFPVYSHSVPMFLPSDLSLFPHSILFLFVWGLPKSPCLFMWVFCPLHLISYS